MDGGGGGGEEGGYNCNIAQAATQLPYALLCSSQLSIAVIYRSYLSQLSIAVIYRSYHQKCSFVSIFILKDSLM